MNVTGVDAKWREGMANGGAVLAFGGALAALVHQLYGPADEPEDAGTQRARRLFMKLSLSAAAGGAGLLAMDGAVGLLTAWLG